MKRGQTSLAIPIITFALIVIILLFAAPFFLKIFNSVVNPLQPILGNQSSAAGDAVGSISSSFTKWWDILIVMAFLANILIFLISAFLIDTHPAFALVFLLAGFFTIIFAPMIMDAVTQIWELPAFATESGQLPITNFLREYYGAIVTGVMMIGGIILYSRIRGGGRGV